MRSGQHSLAIVKFIGSLLPLYVPEHSERGFCVYCLRDGSLIRSVEEPVEDENGRIEIWWQGDQERRSVVSGAIYTQLALSEYVAFHARGNPERFAEQLRYLSEHFQLKTGASLGNPYDDEAPPFELIGKLVEKLIGKLGIAGAIEVLKKLIDL
jgi:hypothetical protein